MKWAKQGFEEMTEFERWLFYHRGENGELYTPTLARYGTDKEEEAAEEGWKAALGWVLVEESKDDGNIDITWKVIE